MHPDLISKTEEIRSWLKTKDVGQAFKPAIRFPELKVLTPSDCSYLLQYKRRLPHWEKEGCTYFVSAKVQPNLGRSFDLLSNNAIAGRLASILEECIFFGFGERYNLDAYVIMPNHMHLLLAPLGNWTLSRIMQGIKGFSAREMNKVLNRHGSFWQDESFDHIIRSEADWLDKFNYIHQNPVRARLVEKPEDYPYSSLVTLHSEGRLESLPHRLKSNSTII